MNMFVNKVESQKMHRVRIRVRGFVYKVESQRIHRVQIGFQQALTDGRVELRAAHF
jgi:hypothetical protein